MSFSVKNIKYYLPLLISFCALLIAYKSYKLTLSNSQTNLQITVGMDEFSDEIKIQKGKRKKNIFELSELPLRIYCPCSGMIELPLTFENLGNYPLYIKSIKSNVFLENNKKTIIFSNGELDTLPPFRLEPKSILKTEITLSVDSNAFNIAGDLMKYYTPIAKKYYKYDAHIIIFPPYKPKNVWISSGGQNTLKAKYSSKAFYIKSTMSNSDESLNYNKPDLHKDTVLGYFNVYLYIESSEGNQKIIDKIFYWTMDPEIVVAQFKLYDIDRNILPDLWDKYKLPTISSWHLQKTDLDRINIGNIRND